MKSRILTNWTFTRTLYFVIGIALMIQSINTRQWFVVIFGAYFASMGLFAFGCAAGNCFGNNCATTPKEKDSSSNQEIEFEEVKTK